MKAQSKKGASAPKRECTRVNLSVDTAAYQRLFVTAVMSGRSAGELVTELIEQHLRSWALPANLAARSGNTHRTAQASQIRDTAQSPAMESAA